MKKHYFSFYNRQNDFTIDEFGNIGRTMLDGTFNSNEVGTNTDTKTIIQIKDNMDMLNRGSQPLEVCYVGDNILKFFGQPLPKVIFVSKKNTVRKTTISNIELINTNGKAIPMTLDNNCIYYTKEINLKEKLIEELGEDINILSWSFKPYDVSNNNYVYLGDPDTVYTDIEVVTPFCIHMPASIDCVWLIQLTDSNHKDLKDIPVITSYVNFYNIHMDYIDSLIDTYDCTWVDVSSNGFGISELRCFPWCYGNVNGAYFDKDKGREQPCIPWSTEEIQYYQLHVGEGGCYNVKIYYGCVLNYLETKKFSGDKVRLQIKDILPINANFYLKGKVAVDIEVTYILND